MQGGDGATWLQHRSESGLKESERLLAHPVEDRLHPVGHAGVVTVERINQGVILQES